VTNRKLISQALDLTGDALIQCPQGKTVHILSVMFNFAAATQSEMIQLGFMQGGVGKALVTSGPADATAGICAFTIGGQATPPQMFAIGDDVITGPLPDVRWDTDVELRVDSLTGFTPSLGMALYEVADAEP